MTPMKLITGLLASWLITLTGTAFSANEYNLLRSDATGFAQVTPGATLSFPEDHLPHPDYRIEWWYLTANLTDDQGRDWGIHWTLFRQSLRPGTDPGGWQSNQVWMAHAAITTPAGHEYEERFARGGIGQAGVSITENGRFDAWLDDWQLQGDTDALLPGTLIFSVNDYQVTLELNQTTPWVLQGDNGYSQKAPTGQASYYYSQPHIEVTGQIQSVSETLSVNGQGWLDREWSSQPLAPDQPGWDWFSLHLATGDALMVYQLRDDQGSATLNGIWVTASGDATPLTTGQIQLTPLNRVDVETRSGPRRMPLSWQLEVADFETSVQITADQPDHWLDTLFPYWEGPVSVSGSHDGVGYMELTGY